MQRTKVFISVLYSKKMKALESLIGMIQKFPYDDPTYDHLHEDLDKIRAKFKQVCPLHVSLGSACLSPRPPHAALGTPVARGRGAVCPRAWSTEARCFGFLCEKTEDGLENERSLELLGVV